MHLLSNVHVQHIAGARQIFHNFFFFFLQGKLPQEVKKKTLF
jgi:hypothetical protein